jgi:hypothetical protein
MQPKELPRNLAMLSLSQGRAEPATVMRSDAKVTLSTSLREHPWP